MIWQDILGEGFPEALMKVSNTTSSSFRKSTRGWMAHVNPALAERWDDLSLDARLALYKDALDEAEYGDEGEHACPLCHRGAR